MREKEKGKSKKEQKMGRLMDKGGKKRERGAQAQHGAIYIHKNLYSAKIMKQIRGARTG